VRSAQVSINVQKNGGLALHPIGRLRGRPIKGSDVPSGGRMMANSKAACEESSRPAATFGRTPGQVGDPQTTY
jgi:hypothetical protein